MRLIGTAGKHQLQDAGCRKSPMKSGKIVMISLQ